MPLTVRVAVDVAHHRAGRTILVQRRPQGGAVTPGQLEPVGVAQERLLVRAREHRTFDRMVDHRQLVRGPPVHRSHQLRLTLGQTGEQALQHQGPARIHRPQPVGDVHLRRTQPHPFRVHRGRRFHPHQRPAARHRVRTRGQHRHRHLRIGLARRRGEGGRGGRKGPRGRRRIRSRRRPRHRQDPRQHGRARARRAAPAPGPHTHGAEAPASTSGEEGTGGRTWRSQAHGAIVPPGPEAVTPTHRARGGLCTPMTASIPRIRRTATQRRMTDVPEKSGRPAHPAVDRTPVGTHPDIKLWRSACPTPGPG